MTFITRNAIHSLLYGSESLRTWQSLNWSRNSPPFTDPEGSLLWSQGLAIWPYPKPHESSPHLTPCFSKIHFYIILPSKSMYSPPPPAGVPTKILYNFLISHMCATCQNLLILLRFIAVIIFGEAYILSNFSSCYFLHHRTTSDLVPNILLSALFS